MYKYVYKGHDCASLKLSINSDGQREVNVDEVNTFLDCRYVSPPEAMWRLHERQLFHRSHTIERLPVHLQEEQMVYFRAGREAETNISKDSKLMAFFKLCNEEEDARQYSYHEIPEHYVWSKGKWCIRARNSKCIGRMYTVNPMDYERYFLRLLLLHTKGPKSYTEIRTVNDVVYDSFQAAAEKLHLVGNNAEWKECLQEATTYQMPTQLRWLLQ